MAFRAFHRDPFAGERARRDAMQDGHFAGEILPGQRRRGLHDLRRSAFGHKMAAELSGSGAEIEYVVGVTDGVLVMFDDEHGVSEIAQRFERGDQAQIVALVQPDGGLVEHVEHSAQAGADLRGEAYPLTFAAG